WRSAREHLAGKRRAANCLEKGSRKPDSCCCTHRSISSNCRKPPASARDGTPGLGKKRSRGDINSIKTAIHEAESALMIKKSARKSLPQRNSGNTSTQLHAHTFRTFRISRRLLLRKGCSSRSFLAVSSAALKRCSRSFMRDA